MSNYRYEVIGLPTIYAADLAGEAVIAKGIRAGLHAVGVDGVTRVREAMRTTVIDGKPRQPVNNGGLWNSITATVDTDGLGVTIGPAPTTADYAAVMELGRKPGGRMPPLDPIFQWVRRKGLASRLLAGRLRELSREKSRARKVSRGGAKLSLAKKAINRDVELDLAFAIRRSIQRKGIKPRKFMARAWPAIVGRASDLLQIGIAHAIAAAARGPRGGK